MIINNFNNNKYNKTNFRIKITNNNNNYFNNLIIRI